MHTVQGLVPTGVWRCGPGPQPTGHLPFDPDSDTGLLVCISQKRTWKRHRDKVTFLKRSQYRHILKSGLPDSRAFTFTCTPVSVPVFFCFTQTPLCWIHSFSPSRLPLPGSLETVPQLPCVSPHRPAAYGPLVSSWDVLSDFGWEPRKALLTEMASNFDLRF